MAIFCVLFELFGKICAFLFTLEVNCDIIIKIEFRWNGESSYV